MLIFIGAVQSTRQGGQVCYLGNLRTEPKIVNTHGTPDFKVHQAIT